MYGLYCGINGVATLEAKLIYYVCTDNPCHNTDVVVQEYSNDINMYTFFCSGLTYFCRTCCSVEDYSAKTLGNGMHVMMSNWNDLLDLSDIYQSFP